METTFAKSSGQATLHLRLAGEGVDRYGANIHQLGQALISSQELVNVAASHEIKRDFPIERYRAMPETYVPSRRFFLQGHLAASQRGSLDFLVQLIGQAELRNFLLNPDVRSFGIAVLANLVTHAALVLAGRWRGMRTSGERPFSERFDLSLAAELAPHLERLSRRITPRSGVRRIELITEDKNGSRVEFRVDSQSRDRVLAYAESAPPSPIEMAGRIRKVDLDSQRATLVHDLTGERIELELSDRLCPLNEVLDSRVYVQGVVRTLVHSGGQVRNLIEVKQLEKLSIDMPPK